MPKLRWLVAVGAALVSLAMTPAAQAQLIMSGEPEKLHDPAELDKKKHGNSVYAEDTPCMTWIDESVPMKGIILCVHGLGLHKGCYAQFAEQMAPQGWGIYAMDVRGFGSFQQMPDVQKLDFDGTIKDVAKTLRFIRQTHPGVPVYLLGESMGGAVTLRTTAFYPELVDGLISSVPAGDRWHMMSDSVKVGMNLFFRPGKTMDVTPILMRSTVKESLRKEWSEDEYARFNLTPMDLIHFQKLCDDNVNCAKKIKKTPVLVVQGENDNLVKTESTKNVTAHIASPDTKLIVVMSGEHLTFEEGQWSNGILEVVLQWLDEHNKALGKPPVASTAAPTAQ